MPSLPAIVFLHRQILTPVVMYEKKYDVIRSMWNQNTSTQDCPGLLHSKLWGLSTMLKCISTSDVIRLPISLSVLQFC